MVHTTTKAHRRPFARSLERAGIALGSVLGLSCCSGVGSSEPALPSGSADAAAISRKWDGVYQGPYHIYLRIVTRGNRATGDWRAIGERNGDFTGTISGNELDLAWTERGSDSSAWSGRGYFVYETTGRSGGAEIHGEWGVGHMASGNSWWALRRGDLATSTVASSLVDHDAGGDDPRADAKSCGGIACDEGEVDPD